MTGQPAIAVLDETGSTNTDLADALLAGEAVGEGDWLVALRQTAGKGRQGRQWFDGAGNFMGSTLVEIRSCDPPPATLSFVAALAVYDAVAGILSRGTDLQTKWPNDILLEGGKLSGILLEMVGVHVVVGIGVNLKEAPQLTERKTAAIADCASPPDPEDFARLLAAAFAARIDQWRSCGLAPILGDFQSKSLHRTGSSVSVHDSDGSIVEGSFAGLEESDGALRLRLADGSERVIRAGDITVNGN